MKPSKAALIAVLGVLAILAAAILGMGALYQGTADNAAEYYSRIDNDSVVPITPHGGMNYRYTLQFYGEDGKGRMIDLDTSRILTDGAFIKIQTAPLRGVLSWEEVQYDQLPPAVQGRYTP